MCVCGGGGGRLKFLIFFFFFFLGGGGDERLMLGPSLHMEKNESNPYPVGLSNDNH